MSLLRRVSAALGAWLCLACSLTLDSDPAQCRSDGDCARFEAMICDASAGVCVQKLATSPAGSSGGPSSPAADLGSTADCALASKPLVEISGDITQDFQLGCDKDYLLRGTVFVREGVTLSIAQGTTLHGSSSPTPGVLVVQPGARLVAKGTSEEPIVFTSALPAEERQPGDWGGIILLGRAPTNHRDESGAPTSGRIEGILEGGEFGGAEPGDSSGEIEYVRIEYSGYAIAPNNEVNGLTLGGVGRSTSLHHVQVRQTTDDCFEFFGGTVNASHLVCSYNGDDGFDWDNGFQGSLQFLVLQQDPRVADETNGFEGDNDADGSENMPLSSPWIANATLCGKGIDPELEQYGMLVRRGSALHVFNTIVTGFEAGYDVRNEGGGVDIEGSLFFGNLARNVAYEEDDSNPENQEDDDHAFDEVAFFMEQGRSNSEADPLLGNCFDPASPDFRPQQALTAGAVALADPNGFFDTGASYVGAFRDATDDWATGAWVRWGER